MEFLYNSFHRTYKILFSYFIYLFAFLKFMSLKSSKVYRLFTSFSQYLPEKEGCTPSPFWNQNLSLFLCFMWSTGFQCPWVSGIPFLSPYTCTRCRFPSNKKFSFISSQPMAEAVSNCHLWTHNQSEFFRGL